LPKEGFKSITVSEDLYQNWMKWYLAEKKKGKIPLYITSFVGFLGYKIEEYRKIK